LGEDPANTINEPMFTGFERLFIDRNGILKSIRVSPGT